MSEQTNEQIAARALETFDRDTDGRTQHPDYYDKQAAAVVKALADTGRIVPKGQPADDRLYRRCVVCDGTRLEEIGDGEFRDCDACQDGYVPVVGRLVPEGCVAIRADRAERMLALLQAYNGFCTSLYDRVTAWVAETYAEKIDAIDAAWEAVQPSDFDPLPR